MTVYVITKTDHLPSKTTLAAECKGGMEVSVTGWIRRWNMYTIGVTLSEETARNMVAMEKQKLVDQYGPKILDDENPDPRHRFFTFGVEMREVVE